MAERKTAWYTMRLPEKPFAIENQGMGMENASSEKNFKMFVETHMRAYGEEADAETIEKYKRDVEEGVIDRDKMLVFTRKGASVGCMSYEVLQTPEGEKCVLIANLGVAIKHQGKGIGRDMLCMALNMLADDFGPGTLVLGDVWADDKAPSTVIEKLGFKKTPSKAWFPV